MTRRWSEVLSLVTYAVAPGPATVVVDGTDPEVVAATADRLAEALRAAGADASTPYEGATISVGGGGPRVVVWLRTGSLDAIFAAGLVMHLPDATEGLRELARATRAGGRLVLFHPSGRARLAARHAAPSARTSPWPRPRCRRPAMRRAGPSPATTTPSSSSSPWPRGMP